MKIEREGKVYEVLEFLPDTQEVCVESDFDFWPNRKQKLKMWWSLQDCKIIEVME